MCYIIYRRIFVNQFFGFSVSFILFQKKDIYLKHLGFHFMTVVLMQLAEFFFFMDLLQRLFQK